MCRRNRYKKPTVDMPDIEDLEVMAYDSIVEATDGCMVEPDGECVHGHVSWFIYLGLI